jgi:hypothetical protein
MKEEGYLMVVAMEKTPKEVLSEEEWDTLVTVMIVGVEDVEEADESDKEIDFES